VSNMYEQWGINLGNSCDITEALSEVEMKITGHNYGVSLLGGEESAVLHAVSDSLKNSVVASQSNTPGSDRADAEITEAEIRKALQDLILGSDFMDISRVSMEISAGQVYQLSPVFSYEDIDIDSYDTVSIKMPVADWDKYGSSEQKHAEPLNSGTMDEGQAIEPGTPVNIPVRLYMKNGELFLKANLSRVNPSDLQRVSGLANMNSVLSLIPR